MSEKMKAIEFEATGRYRLIEKSVPCICQSDELLIKIDAASICGSDINILNDPPAIPARIGTTLGHEMVGTIIKVGVGVKGFFPKDRIV